MKMNFDLEQRELKNLALGLCVDIYENCSISEIQGDSFLKEGWKIGKILKVLLEQENS
jgi:hypothetical protein